MIVYFSGTGNSRFVAQWLATHLKDELYNAADSIRQGQPAKLHTQRPWIFVAPTYAWQLPRVFTDFIRSSTFTGDTRAYFVMTFGGAVGAPQKTLSKLCRKKGFAYQGLLPLHMPENYIALFTAPEEDTISALLTQTRQILKNTLPLFSTEIPLPRVQAGPIGYLCTYAVNPLFYRFAIRAKAFCTTDACNGCGKCKRECPLNNIQLEDGIPQWGDACTHCMACICGCPQTAIEYGPHTKGKRRYLCPYNE